MGKIQKWILKKIAQKTVVQGWYHRSRIVEFYKTLVGAARAQFTEDNKPTLDGFLEECRREALRSDVDGPLMDKWVEKDVAEAVQRLGFCMLDFSINDFEAAGFSQQDIGKPDNEKNPVFVIDLAIALLKQKKKG